MTSLILRSVYMSFVFHASNASVLRVLENRLPVPLSPLTHCPSISFVCRTHQTCAVHDGKLKFFILWFHLHSKKTRIGDHFFSYPCTHSFPRCFSRSTRHLSTRWSWTRSPQSLNRASTAPSSSQGRLHHAPLWPSARPTTKAR